MKKASLTETKNRLSALIDEVREGGFREDLLYRLNAITIEVPALKDRPDDVLPLFHHFLEAAAERERRTVPTIPAELEKVLQDYEWPPTPAWAVYPPTRHLSYRVRAFIDYLASKFEGVPYWDEECDAPTAKHN